MKTYIRYLILTVLTVCFAFVGIGMAGETLKNFGKMQGRSYHSDSYEENGCDYCHENNPPTTFPSDFSCLQCHDMEELVEATARSEEDKWQNPHNNLHYRKDVPCMECHGEHQEREPLCNDCHKFDYSGHKE